MPLIDDTYFVGDIALPNVDQVKFSFNDTMDRYQKEVMLSLLGYELYKDFRVAVDAGEPYPTKWDEFINGAEFTFQFYGKTIVEKWNGLVNTELISLIAYYVYYQYRVISLTTTTAINEVNGIAENAIKAGDQRKMTTSWNNGLRLYGEMCRSQHFDKYSSTYEYSNDRPSAFNFLNANRVNYDNWVFEPFVRLNMFNI